MAGMVRLYTGQQRMVEALVRHQEEKTGVTPTDTEAANHLMHIGWSTLCLRDPKLRDVNLATHKKVSR